MSAAARSSGATTRISAAASAPSVNVKALVWGALFTVAGIGVAAAWLPGATDLATGPRVGAATLFITFGVTLIAMANASWVLRMTTRPEDYRGGCPVGTSCVGCGAFNMKPRTTCRSCGADVLEASEPIRSEAL